MKSAKILPMPAHSSKEPPGKGAPGRRRPGIALKSEQDVRRFLQRIINEARHGEITADQLRALTYAANSLISLFDRFDLNPARKPKVLGTYIPGMRFNKETGEWEKAPAGESEAADA